MLIGVVCDVISDAAAEEEEAETVNMLNYCIQEAFEQIDENEDGLVTEKEWDHIKDSKKVRKTLTNIGIEAERMEERLVQFNEMLFHNDEGEKQTQTELEMVEAASPNSKHTLERIGLSVDELIQKVIEIRPDMNASALDLELLKAQVMKDQKVFQSKLKYIEEGVKQTLGPKAGTGNDHDNMPDMPGMPTMPGLMDEEGEDEGRKITLEDVPTDLLFEALKARAPSDEAGVHH